MKIFFVWSLFTHIYRPEKANIKRKDKLPEEIFSADLTVSLRGEISYLDYFKCAKEKLYKEAVFSGPKSIMTELSCSFEEMAMTCAMVNFGKQDPMSAE